MTFNKSIIETIKKRRSIRTYESHPILEADYQKIKDYLAVSNHLIGPYKKPIRFEIVPVHHNVTDKGIKIGTYGFIKNPQAYIVGMTDRSENSLIEFGYVFQKLMLYLTELNIGTCWLGGTFTRDSFSKELEIDSNHFIPSITPIGYAASKKRIVEKTLRTMVKADNKKPWHALFYYENFDTPLEEMDSAHFHIPIEMVRLGPSASNKQPWRIVLTEDKTTCHFYLEKTPNYSGNKVGFEMQQIDIGIAMCHFELSAIETGLKGEWINSEPNIKPLSNQSQYIMSWKLEKK